MKKVLGLCVAIGGLMKRCHVLPTWIEFRPSHMCHSEVNTTRPRRMRQRRHRHCRAQNQLEVEVLYLNSGKNLKEETHKSYIQFLSEKCLRGAQMTLLVAMPNPTTNLRSLVKISFISKTKVTHSDSRGCWIWRVNSWLVVTGTWLLWLSHHIGNVIIPTDFQRGGEKPPTRILLYITIINHIITIFNINHY